MALTTQQFVIVLNRVTNSFDAGDCGASYEWRYEVVSQWLADHHTRELSEDDHDELMSNLWDYICETNSMYAEHMEGRRLMGDFDPTPEQEAGWAMQDRIDMYRAEY